MVVEKSFVCKITEVFSKDGKCFIKLDKDVFRPSMGGQDRDYGYLVKEEVGKINVLNAFKRGDEVILEIDRCDLDVGDIVKVFIDWDRRKKLSMLHTAQHIFYRSLLEIVKDIDFGNVFLTIVDGEPLGELEVLSNKPIELDDIIRAEITTNKIIFDNRVVKTYFLDKREVSEDIRIRESLLDKVSKVRVVEVDGFDKCACSGTHVNRTGEIQFFKVLGWKVRGSKYKFVFTVGEYALEKSIKLSSTLIDVSQKYGFNGLDLKSFVKNRVDEVKALKKIREKVVDLAISNIICRLEKGEKIILEDLGSNTFRFHRKLLKKILKRIGEKNLVILKSNEGELDYLTVVGDNNKILLLKERYGDNILKSGEKWVQISVNSKESIKLLNELLGGT